jgi:hypothetical protein
MSMNPPAEKKKIIPAQLPDDIYQALEHVVGREWISRDRAVLETYSKLSLDAEGFLKKHAKNASSIPACVVLPGSTDEVRSVVRIAHRYRVPFIPFTNGQMMSAPTFPAPMICIHLSRMNRVLSVDEQLMTATLEPYADYGQLMAEAAKVGLWNGGTPLATTLCKLSSQVAFAGIWQTSKKYGLLDRNIVDIKLVLPTGEIMSTGSPAVAGVDRVWESGPGPDLTGAVRASAGTTGIITEVTVKLHTWVGGELMPEPQAGRPCIPHYAEERYDHALAPPRHRIYWIEFPDCESEIRAYRAIAHAGIGIGLNASGVYSSYYCSPTQKMTEERATGNFFPAFNLYVICAGIVSEGQLEYEEKVLREIAEEQGGRFLSRDYKPEVLEALQPWNLDCIRNVCGYRMNRRMYAGGSLPAGPPEVALYHSRLWREALERFGETHVTDRGGAETTPFVYGIEPAGRYTLSETDIYPDPLDPHSLEQCVAITMYSAVKNGAERHCAPFGFGGPAEPLVTFFPEQGPNVHLLLRKLRKVFDPQGICSPGRQVLTEQELKEYPAEAVARLNELRKLFNMGIIER